MYLKGRLKSKRLSLESYLVAVFLAFILITPAALGGPSKKSTYTKRSKAKHYIVERKILPDAPPEAGVKLLIRILTRIGNNPKIAFQKAQENIIKQEQSQNKTQIFTQAQNATDPALAIRPREKRLATKSKAKILIASQNKLMGKSRSRGRKVAYGNTKGFYYKAANTGADDFGSSSRSNVRNYQGGGMSKESQDRLKASTGRLYHLTKSLSDIQNGATNGTLARRSSALYRRDKSDGIVIAKAPKIVDYTKRAESDAAMEGAALGGNRSLVLKDSRQSTVDENDMVEVEKKLDQPAYFKHMREYKRKAAGATPPPVPRHSGYPRKIAHGFNSLPKSNFGKRNAPMQLAYLPPNLYSGIPGLRLGATTGNVESFLAKNGRIVKSKYNGWDVWVLINKKTNKTSLQVYMRDGMVEAFRIFDSKFVPSSLKISLDTDIESMKEKFGEPAFILNEPSTNKKNQRGIKNYVYPVNQVSFQLARSNTKSRNIIIKSIFLFKFL